MTPPFLIQKTTLFALLLCAATWASAEGAQPHWEYKGNHGAAH